MRGFLRGFVYAGQGIMAAVKEERNLRFHLCAAAYAYLLSLFYPFGKIEYIVLTLLVASVIGVELVNSAIERVVGPPVQGKPDKSSRQAKDMAAGAVLVFAAAALVCGIFLFWDIEVFGQIFLFFYHKPLLLLPLGLSVLGCYWFVFCFNRKDKKG